MSETLVNKIAESGLITLKPEEWVTSVRPVNFDIAGFLFKGLILKEQDFRDAMKKHDWTQYQDKVLCVFCSADAIIPNWAYMLVTTMASSYAHQVFFGTSEQWSTNQLENHIQNMDLAPYKDQRVIIKGCSEGFVIGPEIYMLLTSRLVPIVKSLMFGEPCSTVPVYKRPKAG